MTAARNFGTNTYSAHPVACAAALANIDILERENLFDAAKNQAQYLSQQLQDMREEFPDRREQAGGRR